MRAAQFSSFGGPEVLDVVDVPDPHPGPGEIRIVVRAAGINPVDWKFRQGMMGGDLPSGTGYDAAGVVDELGEDVTGVAVGDQVFGQGRDVAAQLAVLNQWAPLPAGLDFTTAAGLPMAVETATRGLNLLGVRDGDTVLVDGASGGVGSAAVQIARDRGARVIGTASESNHEYLRALGAEVVTYGDGLSERVRALAPEGVDAAFDVAGGGQLPALVELAGGPERVLTIADFEGAQQNGVQVSGGPGTEMAYDAIREIVPVIEAGHFSLPVSRTFPLEDIAEAHRVSEEGHTRGKLVLVVD
jgi:NADPH:quinone reductase-like Zn-dependent oxidoreductase